MPPTSTLSRSRLPSTALPKVVASSPASLAKGSPSSPAVVLLVDDDVSVLRSVGRVLETEGWRVVSAQSGEQALECLAEHEPNLMITDLCMAEVSGWDLLFHVKLQRPDLPIFVITALPPSSAGGADNFATGFFQKPLNFDVMLTSIRRSLTESKATRD